MKNKALRLDMDQRFEIFYNNTLMQCAQIIDFPMSALSMSDVVQGFKGHFGGKSSTHSKLYNK